MITSMHAQKRCEGEFCPFHNPSDHHMKTWPMVIRYDRYGLTERLCGHGYGHPDPDSVTWLKKLYDNGTLFNLGILEAPSPERVADPDFDPYSIFTLHGCDFCCSKFDTYYERPGWHAFGSHIDQPHVELEFEGKDEDGLPVWERIVQR